MSPPGGVRGVMGGLATNQNNRHHCSQAMPDEFGRGVSDGDHMAVRESYHIARPSVCTTRLIAVHIRRGSGRRIPWPSPSTTGR